MFKTQSHTVRSLIGIICGLGFISCAGEGSLSGEHSQDTTQKNPNRSQWITFASQPSNASSNSTNPSEDNIEITADGDSSFNENASIEDSKNKDKNENLKKTDRHALLNDWCRGATQTKLVNSKEGLKSVLSHFCEGQIATELFTRQLIDTAYDGKNEIIFKELNAPAQSKGRGASVNLEKNLGEGGNQRGGGGGGVGGALAGKRFAYALKLPLKPDDVFKRQSLGTEEAGLKSTIEASGFKGSVKALSEFQNDGPSHVRGIEFFKSILVDETSKKPQSLEANARTDSYKLPGTDLYMFTLTLTKPIKLLGKDDLIGAIVSIDGSTYILGIHDQRFSASKSSAEQAVQAAKKGIQANAYTIWRNITSAAP